MTRDRAVLDFVTATIELIRVEDAAPPTWLEDDVQRGFRHIGFKVADLDGIVATLREAGVRFRFEPFESQEAGVRIVFFFDPDGTVIELVERHVRYAVVFDESRAATERALPTPTRPRFDHIGQTVGDLAAAVERNGRRGFVDVGALFGGERGARIDYLHGQAGVLELFSFAVPTVANPVRLDTTGFLAVELDGPPPDGAQVVGQLRDGRLIAADADDLGFTAAIG